MEDPLSLIDQSRWSSLVSLFPGAEGITARVTIKTQIVNLKSNPDLPVKFYSPLGDPTHGLVVIFELVEHVNEISVFCLNEDKSILSEALLNSKVIDKNKFNLFCCVMPQVCPLIVKLAESWQIKHNVDQTVIAHIDKQKATQFPIPDCPGMSIKMLDPKYCYEIDEVWPHRHPGSDKYFEAMLKRGYGIGFIDNNDDELVGWIFTNLRGDLHSLHVKDKYRRRGIGKLLIEAMSKRVADKEIEVFGCVVTNNIASKALFTKCGFEFSYVTSWISVLP